MKQLTDTEIRVNGIAALIASLGEVQAERFISLILREPFDYTQWHAKLWVDTSLEDLSRMAMDYRRETKRT
ncbi:hypothetical protein [uncultured Thiothrix sp.]|uniref:hypothetical protein n=1 Tax=uncultured Thiothrix sp. TaxID=223185 RepID=UPI0026293701|nr:hypothetical protein [uncultured Thiothrix sp.]